MSDPKVITGTKHNRSVLVDGKPLTPTKSFKLRNHSPTGFMWGYGGSGPSQLALAILMLFIDDDDALRLYMDFKWEVVAKMPNDFILPGETVRIWISEKAVAA